MKGRQENTLDRGNGPRKAGAGSEPRAWDTERGSVMVKSRVSKGLAA